MGNDGSSKLLSSVEVWKEIGKDLDTGLEDFATNYSLDKGVVIAFGVLDSFNQNSVKDLYLNSSQPLSSIESKPSFEKALKIVSQYKKQIGFHLFIILIITFVLAGSFLNVWRGVTDQNVVKAKKEIPAFYRITESELVADGSEKLKPLILGRYTLKSVLPNSIISPDKLLDSALSQKMNGRIIITVLVKAENFNSDLGANSMVCLLLSPHQNSAHKSVALDDVILLQTLESSDTFKATVAISKGDFQKVRDILATSQIYVLKEIKKAKVKED